MTLLFLSFQRFHRWSQDRGAKAGEGRRDQYLLRGLGASVREVPQVSVRDLTGQRRKERRGFLLSPVPVLFPSFVAARPFYFILLLLSQDYDAVGSEKHQNARQVLVPQELPVPGVQGEVFTFRMHHLCAAVSL